MKTRFRTKAKVALAALLFGTVSVAQAVPFSLGDIFASTGNGTVQQRSSAGVLLDTLNTGQGGFTTGAAFDSAGNFYVTNFGANSVTRFAGPGDPHTTSLFGGPYSTPESIVFAANGNVLVGQVGNNGIREMDSAGNFVKQILPGVRVDFFDLGADQETIIYGQELGDILTASRSTGLPTGTFSSGPINAFAMRFLPTGGVLLADRDDVKQFDSTGAIIATYDVTGDNGFFGLNLVSATEFLTASFGTGNIYRFSAALGPNLNNQTQTINTLAGGSLFGVAVFGEVTVAQPPPTGVPEPVSLLLLGIGLAALAATRRRR